MKIHNILQFYLYYYDIHQNVMNKKDWGDIQKENHYYFNVEC